MICFWYIHCLWYIHCALFMYIIATLVFLSSHTVSPSPTLLLPFIGYCLVSVTCLRVFCGIFSSNMRFSFFSPPFSTSTLGTNLLLPVLIIMFIICTACSSPFSQMLLVVFNSENVSDWITFCAVSLFFSTPWPVSIFKHLYILRKKGTWAKRTTLSPLKRNKSLPPVFLSFPKKYQLIYHVTRCLSPYRYF